MDVLSKIDFAAAHRVSRAAITQAVKRGALAVTSEGKVVLHHPTTVEWARNRTPKGDLDAMYAAVLEGKKSKIAVKEARKATKVEKANTRTAEIATRKADKATAVATQATAAKQAEIDTGAAEVVLENALAKAMAAGGDDPKIPSLAEIDPKEIWRYPKAALDKLRIFEVALKTQQDREQKRGELISRDVVASLFSKIHAVDSNELRTLEERIIPTLCSVAGFADDDPRVLKIQLAINKETTRTLRHSQRIIDTFLENYAE